MARGWRGGNGAKGTRDAEAPFSPLRHIGSPAARQQAISALLLYYQHLLHYLVRLLLLLSALLLLLMVLFPPASPTSPAPKPYFPPLQNGGSQVKSTCSKNSASFSIFLEVFKPLPFRCHSQPHTRASLNRRRGWKSSKWRAATKMIKMSFAPPVSSLDFQIYVSIAQEYHCHSSYPVNQRSTSPPPPDFFCLLRSINRALFRRFPGQRTARSTSRRSTTTV